MQIGQGFPLRIPPSSFLILFGRVLSIQSQHPCRCSAHRDFPTIWPRLQSVLQLGIDFCRQSLPTAPRQPLHWLGVATEKHTHCSTCVKVLRLPTSIETFHVEIVDVVLSIQPDVIVLASRPSSLLLKSSFRWMSSKRRSNLHWNAG